ncbi:7594_t:CDS:2, partial [Gigaspora rosea]
KSGYTREQVQTWFNDLMKVANKLWGSVTARVLTVLELKRPKNASGLTDEAKGQLLDYIRILVQKQPSRQTITTLNRAHLEEAIHHFQDDMDVFC